MNIENPEDADIYSKNTDDLDWADYQFKDQVTNVPMVSLEE